MATWKSKNRHKYLLQYHIIFVCKYRKKLLVSRQISDDIKQFSYEICQRHSVIIRYMEKISPIFTKQFWKEHTFWTDGYFACSVGNVSEEMLKRYIENQG
ncbi:transposase [Dorea longicatena]|uniref:transposase n=1 Tax=Dorea longicatena TaxID=88431 RepID=UPI000E470D7C|nr:transposase [Dorea longicatena]